MRPSSWRTERDISLICLLLCVTLLKQSALLCVYADTLSFFKTHSSIVSAWIAWFVSENVWIVSTSWDIHQTATPAATPFNCRLLLRIVDVFACLCALLQVCVEDHWLGRMSHPPLTEPAGPPAGEHQYSVWRGDPDQENLLWSSPWWLSTTSQEGR